MGVSKCYSLMKCLLILLSILFMCVGACVCAFVTWAVCEGIGAGSDSEDTEARAGLAALGAWGGALAIGGAAGVWGGARGGGGALALCLALLAAAAAAEGGAAWWGAAHVPRLRRALTARLHRSLLHEYGHSHAATDVLDTLQQELQCCGVESARDWQRSSWSRQQPISDELGSALPAPAPAEPASEPAQGDAPPPAPRAAPPLDLSVSAPPTYYWVPESCCLSAGSDACSAARRVPAASGGAAGLHVAGCGARALAALQRGARVPLAVAALLAALHAAALLLALALAAHPAPHARYKA